MPGKRKDTMDIREIVRRIRQGQSNRAIAKEIGIDRKTVGRYHTWAREQGLLDGELPAEQAQAVDAHVQACDACARELAQLEAVVAQLHRLDRDTSGAILVARHDQADPAPGEPLVGLEVGLRDPAVLADQQPGNGFEGSGFPGSVSP